MRSETVSIRMGDSATGIYKIFYQAVVLLFTTDPVPRNYKQKQPVDSFLATTVIKEGKGGLGINLNCHTSRLVTDDTVH